jgi:hypothetical protein
VTVLGPPIVDDRRDAGGAAVGALLVLHAGLSAALALTLALLCFNSIAVYPVWSQSAA